MKTFSKIAFLWAGFTLGWAVFFGVTKEWHTMIELLINAIFFGCFSVIANVCAKKDDIIQRYSRFCLENDVLIMKLQKAIEDYDKENRRLVDENANLRSDLTRLRGIYHISNNDLEDNWNYED